MASKLLDIATGMANSGAGALLDTALGGIQQNRIDKLNSNQWQKILEHWELKESILNIKTV